MIEPVIIGNATLYCGDAREVLPTLSGVQCLVTDPPYGMAFQSNHRNVQWRKIIDDDTDDLLRWACEIEASHSSYIFCRWDNLAAVPRPKSCVVWVKDNHSMGDLEHEHGRQYEVALFYAGPEHSFPRKRPTDVIKCPRTNNDFHPTEKPVGLMRAVIEWTAGTVVDPFMGSGTTGVAAVQIGRRFIGIERDERHFETACKRIADAHRQADLFGGAR